MHKHRTIVTPAVTLKEVSIVGMPYVQAKALLCPSWNRRKNEIIISRAPGKGTVHHDIDFSIGIAFGKVPRFGGFPVFAGLRYLTTIVKSIVMATEAEALRIGAIN